VAAQRPASWFRYFSRFGVQPTVVAKDWPESSKNALELLRNEYRGTWRKETTTEGSIYRVPVNPRLPDRFLLRFGEQRFSTIRKLFTWIYKSFAYLSFFFDKHANIYRQADKLMQQEKFDALLITGEPFVLFRYGYLLSKKYKTPWIADYRDGWKLNHVERHKRDVFNRILQWWEFHFEKKFLPSCLFVTNTEPLTAARLQELLHKTTEVIYNGFDRFYDSRKPAPEADRHRLVLTHSGTLVPGQRVEFLLQALRELVEEKKVAPGDILLRFIGLNYQPGQLRRVLGYHPSLLPFLESTDRMSREAVLEANAHSDFLLSLTEDFHKTIFAKTYDYLAVRKPILVLPDDESILGALVTGLRAGYAFKETSALKTFLLQKIQSKKKGTLEPWSQADPKQVLAYTREAQAEALCAVLRKYVNPGVPRVLVLCHDFPPYNSVGAQRPYSWFRHFRKYGLHPCVVTRHWDEVKNQTDFYRPSKEQYTTWEQSEFGEIVRAPYHPHGRDRLVWKYGFEKYKLLRKVLTFFYYNLRFELGFLDSTRPIYREAKRLLRHQPIQLIIASGEPFLLFKHAAKLSRRFQVPWVADYRDGWSTNHALGSKVLSGKFLLSLEAWHEKKYVRSALFFDSVSAPIVKGIEALVKIPGYEIPNGTELPAADAEAPLPLEEKFTVTYTGLIYDSGYGDILIEGLKLFLSQQPRPQCLFRFVGTEMQQNKTRSRLLAFAQQYPEEIQFLPRVSPEEASRMQRSSQVLLSLIPGSHAKGIISAKTYGYAASGRPTLVIPSEPSRETPFFPGRDIQHFCLTPEEVFSRLSQFYALHEQGSSFPTSITPAERFSISREAQAARLAGIALEYLHPSSPIHTDTKTS